MSMSDDSQNASTAGKCPFHQGGPDHSAGAGRNNRDWWPNQLRVDLLNQHSNRSNPLGEDFDYRKEFSKLDYSALKGDLKPFCPNLNRGGPLTGALMPVYLSVWHGTAQGPIVPSMDAVARVAGSSVLHH